MMALHHDAQARAASGVLDSPPRVQRASGPANDVAARLRLAAALLPEREDDAALLLDGLLREILHEWCLLRGLVHAGGVPALAVIERAEPLFGWRLRLALRAPDARARLVHCASLLAMLPGADIADNENSLAAVRGR